MSGMLFLVRHGAAEPASPSLSDEERPLTTEGREILARAAQGLRRLGVALPPQILTSPLVRAVETAEILARHFSPEPAVQPRAALAPGAPLEGMLALVEQAEEVEVLMLVGHEPATGELASCVLGGSPGVVKLRFRPGSIAAIELPQRPLETPASLRWFMQADQLAEIGHR